ncbi:MAG: hypothetical protein A4E45_01089 [Methanosaeta sp. PtaB.Bin039]|nr:MAG: hypothetical protein A4E45_01089 [Methanosaeta sp. PtaB.Bin039]HQF15867.1 hypothetical protein [Methanotrichaceae archaeon]HQI90457.1 hypothetical protein [Methanotrichaceae archaeon]HQJ28154.1 hypothetical protein [Methanotrichaceae archaeon]
MIPGEITRSLSKLGLAELCELRDLADGLIREQMDRAADQQHPSASSPKPGDVAQTRHMGPITYQLEWISCGKGCKGCPHGPYWYGYWREEGRTRSKYIGKRLKAADISGDAGILVRK